MRMLSFAAILLLVLLPTRGRTEPRSSPDSWVNTFSIVARDPRTGELGVAVESRYFGVGAVVPWARAGVGAIATQSLCKTTYGSEGLELLAQGKAPVDALAELTKKDPGRERRQVGMIAADGRTAVFTGAGCIEWAGHREGRDFAVQGNLLTGPQVVDAMAAAFERARNIAGSELADWLVAALQAGQAAGGDRRGQQSAALLVVRERGGLGGDGDRFIDLRVEDDAEPIEELARLLDLHKRFYPR